MDDEQLQKALGSLKSRLERSELKIPDGETIEELRRIRKREDGTPDLATVGPLVRALALAIQAVDDRAALKAISLRDIQCAYFEWLERAFGDLHREMTGSGLTPGQVGQLLARDHETVARFANDSDDLYEQLEAFWSNNGPAVDVHLEDTSCMKAVYGGDFFPPYGSRAVTAAGVYMDTVVLPDPIFRTGLLHGASLDHGQLERVIKYALTALSARDLVLADVNPPIAVINPDRFMLDTFEHKLVRSSATCDAQRHVSTMFGREFTSPEAAEEFCRSLGSVDAIVQHLAAPARLLFDSDETGEPAEKLAAHIRFVRDNFKAPRAVVSPGEDVWLHVAGRMVQANIAVVRASRCGGSPLIEAPTSWQYLLWKYEYDDLGSRTALGTSAHATIVKTLQVQGSDLIRLLTHLDTASLIELRQSGAMAELRGLMQKGIEEIAGTAAPDLEKTTRQVTANLNAAFEEHTAKLEEHRRKRRRFFGLKVAPFIGAASLAIAATASANPFLNILKEGTKLLAPFTLVNVWKAASELVAGGRVLRRSPVGILYREVVAAQQRRIKRRRQVQS